MLQARQLPKWPLEADYSLPFSDTNSTETNLLAYTDLGKMCGVAINDIDSEDQEHSVCTSFV